MDANRQQQNYMNSAAPMRAGGNEYRAGFRAGVESATDDLHDEFSRRMERMNSHNFVRGVLFFAIGITTGVVIARVVFA